MERRRLAGWDRRRLAGAHWKVVLVAKRCPPTPVPFPPLRGEGDGGWGATVWISTIFHVGRRSKRSSCASRRQCGAASAAGGRGGGGMRCSRIWIRLLRASR